MVNWHLGLWFLPGALLKLRSFMVERAEGVRHSSKLGLQQIRIALRSSAMFQAKRTLKSPTHQTEAGTASARLSLSFSGISEWTSAIAFFVQHTRIFVASTGGTSENS